MKLNILNLIVPAERIAQRKLPVFYIQGAVW